MGASKSNSKGVAFAVVSASLTYLLMSTLTPRSSALAVADLPLYVKLSRRLLIKVLMDVSSCCLVWPPTSRLAMVVPGAALSR